MPPNDQPQFVTQESFQKFGEQLVDVLGKVGSSLSEIRAHQVKGPAAQPHKSSPAQNGADPAAAKPNADTQAILNGLLAGDSSALDTYVQKAIAAAAPKDPRVDQLAAIASTEATERVQANQEHFQAALDRQYGTGAYDKFFRAAVAEKFKENPGLQANRTYFANVVNLVRGEQFDALATHQAAQQKEAAEKAAAAEKEKTSVPYPFMLGAGSPIARDGKVQFDDADRNFASRFEDRMGEKFDLDRAGKILQATAKATQESNAPFVSVSLDQLQAALKPADKAA